ncbi:MAG: hypothetical protein IKR83_05190 [Bacteroidales bacterium]|nr:hypothetical protein [Bacteroidales bacterium]
MKKIYFALGAAVAALAIFTGCTRDMVTSMNSLTLEAENYKSEEKAYISGNTACWENNDQIKLTRNHGGDVNHYDGSISITHPGGSNRADVVANGFTTEGGDVIYACYPQSKFSGGVTNPASITVNLPSEYQYVVTNGKQKIEALMIGKLTIQDFEEGQTNPNIMKLKNLCTLLRITLEAPTLGAFSVDKIAVTSDITLNGPATIDFSGATPSLTMNNPYNHGAENDCVVLNFGTNAVGINGTKEFFIPVPPLPNGKTLKIWIHNAVTGNWFTRNVSTQDAIPGNTIATLTGPATDDEDANYTFYSYIKNTNNKCFIDLGVKPDNTSKMEMTFKVTNPGGSQYYSGSSVAGRYLVYAISGANADSYLTCHFFDDYISSESPNPGASILRNSGNKYRVTAEVLPAATPNYYFLRTTFEELDASDNTIKIITKDSPAHEGGLVESNFASGIPNIYVFGFNTSRHNPGMKLYTYKVWKGGELLYNFVPAERNSDHVKGVLNMATTPYTFIPGTGASGYSYTLGND